MHDHLFDGFICSHSEHFQPPGNDDDADDEDDDDDDNDNGDGGGDNVDDDGNENALCARRRNRRVSPLMFYVYRSFGSYPSSFFFKGENEKTMYMCG